MHKGKNLTLGGRRPIYEPLLLSSHVLNCPEPQSLAFKTRTLPVMFPAEYTAQQHSTLVRTSAILPCFRFQNVTPPLGLCGLRPCICPAGPIVPSLRMSRVLGGGPWEPCLPVWLSSPGVCPIRAALPALGFHELSDSFSFGLKLRLLPVTQT